MKKQFFITICLIIYSILSYFLFLHKEKVKFDIKNIESTIDLSSERSKGNDQINSILNENKNEIADSVQSLLIFQSHRKEGTENNRAADLLAKTGTGFITFSNEKIEQIVIENTKSGTITYAAYLGYKKSINLKQKDVVKFMAENGLENAYSKGASKSVIQIIRSGLFKKITIVVAATGLVLTKEQLFWPFLALSKRYLIAVFFGLTLFLIYLRLNAKGIMK